jgi:hypothetical protein
MEFWLGEDLPVTQCQSFTNYVVSQPIGLGGRNGLVTEARLLARSQAVRTWCHLVARLVRPGC